MLNKLFPGLAPHCRVAVFPAETEKMASLKNYVHRLALEVVSQVISFVYNPYQVEVLQLLWNLYELFGSTLH